MGSLILTSALWNFSYIVWDGFVDDSAVEQAMQNIKSPQEAEYLVDGIFLLARERFSLEGLEKKVGTNSGIIPGCSTTTTGS
jgi:hypothetical protein